MHSDIKLLMDREQELANSGWNMTPGELTAQTSVFKAAACWFAFAYLHPRESSEFLISQRVVETLHPQTTSRSSPR